MLRQIVPHRRRQRAGVTPLGDLDLRVPETTFFDELKTAAAFEPIPIQPDAMSPLEAFGLDPSQRPGVETQWLIGTHADRLSLYPPDTMPAGSRYFESDRKLLYISDGSNWIYVSGSIACTQSTLPGDLTANDAGLAADVTDFLHKLRWGGSSWAWAPGDVGTP